jgi:hypothetical protein
MFVSAISWMSIALCGFLFVDDADLLFMAPTTHQQGEEIAESAQRHLDEWEGLIHATGGALVPSKSFWYLVDFNGMAQTGSTRTQLTCLPQFQFKTQLVQHTKNLHMQES